MSEQGTGPGRTPWSWGNPLTTKLERSAIRSSKIGLVQEWTSPAPFTSTTMNTWLEIDRVSIAIVPGNNALFAATTLFLLATTSTPTDFVIRARVLLAVDDAESSWYTLLTGALNPIQQNVYETLHMSSMFNIPANLPNVIPGDRALAVEIQNDTPGTGTIDCSGGADDSSLFGFVVGDLT